MNNAVSAQDDFAFEVVVSGVPMSLYYLSSVECVNVDIGHRVEVSVGRRITSGWVVGRELLDEVVRRILPEKRSRAQAKAKAEQSTALDKKAAGKIALKPILSSCRAFSTDQFELFKWIADYYGASLADVIDNAVPTIKHSKPIAVARLAEKAFSSLKNSPKWLSDLANRASVQAKIIEVLQSSVSPVAVSVLNQISPSSNSALKALLSKELVIIEELVQGMPSQEEFLADIFSDPTPKLLTHIQAKAVQRIVESIRARSFSPYLLFGVTGSGKTEVYLRAIAEVLDSGGSALVIVPEIALTPQLLGRFRSRLAYPLAVLHSEVNPSERWEAWHSLLNGDIRLAVGARSAIFAPLKNLSLIIVDEEHESSYKQSEGLRYNARDVAVMRAKLANCPIILGSATPSFESLINSKKSRYQLIEMPERVTARPLPQIEIVDLSKVRRADMISENFSQPLYAAIDAVLKANQQAVVLYNRRGYSSYMQCDTCGEVIKCPNCSIALTYHKRRNVLLCHYCDSSITPPSLCRYCCDPKTTRIELDEAGLSSGEAVPQVGQLVHRGGGTERVDIELQALFPEARIARMDRDTVGRKGAYKEILGAMHSGETDILVGTQMIAKGHDLPGVTLVGVVDADVGFNLPDFRASEKAYQLMAQASGRAGRGAEAGRVIIQTRQPHHPTIVALETNRFKAFARYELDQRAALDYPPFGYLMRLIISDEHLDKAYECARMAAEELRKLVAKRTDETLAVSILGPSPAPLERLRGRFRWHILVKTTSRKLISQLARAMYGWKTANKKPDSFRIAIDVDPLDMM